MLGWFIFFFLGQVSEQGIDPRIMKTRPMKDIEFGSLTLGQNYFLQLCFHGSAPVIQVIAKRGINCDPRCPLCRNEDESIAHMLKDCLFALNLWERIGVPQPLTSTFQLDLLKWLKRNCLCSNQFQINGIPWSTLFLFTIWELWKHRNGVVFDNKHLNFNLHNSCI